MVRSMDFESASVTRARRCRSVPAVARAPLVAGRAAAPRAADEEEAAFFFAPTATGLSGAFEADFEADFPGLAERGTAAVLTAELRAELPRDALD